METKISMMAAGVPAQTEFQVLPDKFFRRLVWSVPPMAVAGFSLFGFFDTFEPMPRIAQLSWRAAYVCTGFGSVVAICWIWLKSSRQPAPRQT